MIKLSDVIDALANTELSTLSVVVDGEIPPEHYKRIVIALNRATSRLATRLTVKKGFLTLQTRADEQFYSLTTENTVSSGNPNAYIIDTALNPFKTEHLLEILNISTLKDKHLSLDGSDGVVRISVNRLKFAQDMKEDVYTITYSALPELIDVTQFVGNVIVDPETVMIDLPLAYMNALIFFVASVFHAPTVSTLDDLRTRQDINYHHKFEAECLLLESKGVDIDEDVPTNLFHQRGFI